MKRCVLGVLLLIFAAAVAADSGEEPEVRAIGGLTFADRFELTIVNVFTYVTDKKGMPVTDLAKADFRVFQDGEEREISNFQLFTADPDQSASESPSETPPEVTQASAPAGTEPQSGLDSRPTSIVIYLDNKNLHPLDRNRVLRDIRGFVLENLRPPVQMMVVTFHQELKILQPFTSDPRLILDALSEVRTQSGGKVFRDSARQDILDRMWEESERMGGQVSGYGVQRTRSYTDVLTYAEEETHDLLWSMEALREVVGFLVGLPGRKSVLYISNGIPMIPGMDLFNAYASAIRDPTVLSELQRYDRSTSFQSLVDAANTQDVTFYTIGAGGLQVPGMSTSGERSNRSPVAPAPAMDSKLDGLRFMAKGTGGLAIVKTNDFADGFEKIERDLHTYYSLGYRLIPTGSDKVHSIEVTIPGRPELVVRCRSRFVEKSLGTRVQERVLASLITDVGENPMALEVTTGAPSLATGDRWSVPIHVSFPLGRIAVLPEGEEHVGRVVLFVAARDADGNSSETVREDFELRLPASGYEQTMESSFSLATSLLMEAGSFRVAVGLMDEVTRQASFRTVNITLSPR